jgi:hypothetical protein
MVKVLSPSIYNSLCGPVTFCLMFFHPPHECYFLQILRRIHGQVIILWHVYPLLGNDSEIGSYTISVAK